MKKTSKHIGEIFYSTEGYPAKITNYKCFKEVTIEFEDGNSITTTLGNIRKGRFKNSFFPIICGVGYFGVGKHDSKDKAMYNAWKNMIIRCYDLKEAERQPAYKGCTVCEEWHNYQNFAEYYTENFKEGYQLDKDIIKRGNKIYNKENCCFIPRWLNVFFANQSSRNTSGQTGVSLRKGNGRWRARINDLLTGKTRNIGTFNDKKEATKEYLKARLNNFEKAKIKAVEENVDVRALKGIDEVIGEMTKEIEELNNG